MPIEELQPAPGVVRPPAHQRGLWEAMRAFSLDEPALEAMAAAEDGSVPDVFVVLGGSESGLRYQLRDFLTLQVHPRPANLLPDSF